MKYFNYIKAELDQIEKSFEKNELAFLALTSKIELPIRDRLAFSLHKKYWADDIIVTREWLRTDLTLLKNNIPLIICELKAGYTFDPIYNLEDYFNLIRSDFEKSKVNAKNIAEITSIFLTTHVHQNIDKKYRGIIKYHGGINRALKQYENQRAVLEKASISIRNKFLKFEISEGKINGGNAFNCDVEIYYWMFSEKVFPL